MPRVTLPLLIKHIHVNTKINTFPGNVHVLNKGWQFTSTRLEC